MQMTRHAPDQTMRAFVYGQGHAIVAWALVAPLAIILIAAVLAPLLRALMRASAPQRLA
jgi:hypothetical protein